VPRTGPPRTIDAETNLARRVKTERDRRGWTLETVARRMTALGCPLSASALSKVERQDPPRRITANELAAFALVFETSADNLLLAPELAEDARLGELFREQAAAMERARVAMQEFRARQREVAAHLFRTNPGGDRMQAAIQAAGVGHLLDGRAGWPMEQRTKDGTWTPGEPLGGQLLAWENEEIDEFLYGSF
jgi:transcriptional regulator with XRE-family HTH domain